MSVKLSHHWNDRINTNFVLSSSEYFSNRDRNIGIDVSYNNPSNDAQTPTQSSSNEDNNLADKTLLIENDLYLDQVNTLGFGLQITKQNIDYSLI